MKRKYIWAGLGAALLPGLSEAAPKRAKSEKEGRMNVLFILCDDMRPTWGCYGDPHAVTPNLDSLAGRGVLFRQAYCQQAVSNPSRASMLTGLRPDQTGVTDLYTNFRSHVPEAVTLPQLFKNNGYYAAGAGKVFHAVGRDVDAVSWSEMDYLERRGYLLPESLPPQGGKGVTHEAVDVPDAAYPDGEIADRAVGLIRKAARQRTPFFIAVGFLKPHLPFNAPKRYWDLYADTTFRIAHRERPAGSPGIAFHNSNELRGYTNAPKQGPLSPDLEQELWHGYYACVSYVDAQIGKLMAALERYDLADKTLVVVLGDHGYHLGEQRLWCKSTNFELDTRMPLLIVVPGGRGMGRVEPSIVEAVDIYPTLADYCALPATEKLAGVSLRKLMQQDTTAWDRCAFSQFVRPYQAISKPVRTHMGYSVRTPGWRFTAWYDLKTGRIDERELYSIGPDGVETENRAGDAACAWVEEELLRRVEAYKNRNYER